MACEIMNITRVWSVAMACLCYCHFVSARLPQGKWRLISLLPVFPIFAALPLHTTSAFFTALTAFSITWLATFKLLLFAFDASQPSSIPAFIATVALPFRVRPKNAPSRPHKKLPLNLATEIPIAASLISILSNYKDRIGPNPVLLAYCCLVFLMVDIVVEISSSAGRALLGLELEPASDEPYLATSLREFWGRRWNLTVNDVLRRTVYRPVRSAAGGGRCAAMAAVMGSFLVSGLMHELLFWYVTRAWPSWEMTAFFVLHGACVAAEFGLGAAGRDRWRLPWFVGGPLTIGFVVGSSSWLFFPPLVRNGADVRVIEEFRYVAKVVKGNIVNFLCFVGSRQD
ncbi:MBOAT (membrane bound O-acyl transferase) family protein [Striga asiatica]|uniref:MBOAT (Membrane bound O-acyl transferase) family protein n=1 Tax=Striga asiatica TaxID=4170 RepID=A0A5A7PJC3_STRAF|nr:MBOAT (membrane bound O-acyl transferase) family protein [Striga asiatica]